MSLLVRARLRHTVMSKQAELGAVSKPINSPIAGATPAGASKSNPSLVGRFRRGLGTAARTVGQALPAAGLATAVDSVAGPAVRPMARAMSGLTSAAAESAANSANTPASKSIPSGLNHRPGTVADAFFSPLKYINPAVRVATGGVKRKAFDVSRGIPGPVGEAAREMFRPTNYEGWIRETDTEGAERILAKRRAEQAKALLEHRAKIQEIQKERLRQERLLFDHKPNVITGAKG